MKKIIIASFFALIFVAGSVITLHAWGFWGHHKINRLAVFTLPDPLKTFYEKHIDFITDHAVDPDLRRNLNKNEGVRHFIDAEIYGKAPFDSIPKLWKDAVKKYNHDTLMKYGINPWYVDSLMTQLTQAFRDYKIEMALAISADLGHYIGDAHVPLHTSVNYDGQLTNQKGIHGLWESRIPEILGDKYNLYAGKAVYIADPLAESWKILRESYSEKDSVLYLEKHLNDTFPQDKKYTIITKNDTVKIQIFSERYARSYNALLNGMVERKMRESIKDVGSFWYTAWVNAGRPMINEFDRTMLTPESIKKLTEEESKWVSGSSSTTH